MASSKLGEVLNLTHVCMSFLAHFEPKDVAAHLKEAKIITPDDYEKITNKEGLSHRVTEFLDVSRRKIHDVDIFLEALEVARYTGLVLLLKAELGKRDGGLTYENAIYQFSEETRGILEDLKIRPDRKTGRPPGFNEIYTYPNFTDPKGLALIINNVKFPDDKRIGSEIDYENVSNLFAIRLKYSLFQYTDLTAQGMLEKIQEFAKKLDHNKAHSAVVVVMTHGDDGGLFGVDGQRVEVRQFVNCLNAENAPLLEKKPKLFFIQACRGKAYDFGHMTADGIKFVEADGDIDTIRHEKLDDLLKKDTEQAKIFCQKTGLFVDSGHTRIPTESHMFTAFSSMPGRLSIRSDNGSWFIQSFCEVFCKDAESKRLLDMMTKVNRRVAQKIGQPFRDDPSTICKAVSQFESSLEKPFFFYPENFD